MEKIIQRHLRNIPDFWQRQDSLYDQMKDSIPILIKFGMYDLSYFIKNEIKRMER